MMHEPRRAGLWSPIWSRAVHNVEILEKCHLAYLIALCTDRKITNKIPLARAEKPFSKLRKVRQKAAAGNS